MLYKVLLNTNRKMTLEVYRDKILEPVIKEQLQKKLDFVLEEDRDSEHNTRKQNIVRIQKEKNGLEYYQNCLYSPDLAPIENVWGIEKAYIRKFTHWSKEETEELALEAWNEGVSQKKINSLIDSMPQRLQAVIDMEGRMTGY